MKIKLLIVTLLLCTQTAYADSDSVWRASIGLGHQACLAEGGAVCTTAKDGFQTSLAFDYAILDWLEVGVDAGYGYFAKSDGYETVTSLFNITTTYQWQDWSLIGNGGIGFLNAWFQREERGAGSVVYDYTTFAAIRFGGGFGYEISDDYRVSILSHLFLGGKGELCPTIAGVDGECRSNQDLIDLLATSARLTYRF